MQNDPLDFSDTVDSALREHSAKPTARGAIRVTDGVVPIFFAKEIEDAAASEQAGRPIYKAVDWIEIIVPGSRDRVSCPVRKEHRERFPEQWESYKRQEARTVADGTPITEWQGIPRTRALELRALGFYTVEQLAAAPENQLQKAGQDARRIQEQAQAFIKSNSDLEGERRLRGELEAKFSELVALNQELATQLTELRRKVDGDVTDDTAGGAGGRTRSRNRPSE
jgi:hypothetical protein